MFFRKMKKSHGSPSREKLAEIEQEIAKYESLITEAPQRLNEQRERERNTIPPPDDFADRRRERRFYAELSRGQVINERRHRTRNTVLCVLFLAAIGAVAYWIVQELSRNGIL